ncbi:MAG: ATP synthase F0 subunit B [Acidobacteriota bacterium]|nr:ATP synthase F0 subunit B [Acidobacteriota bacterium]
MNTLPAILLAGAGTSMAVSKAVNLIIFLGLLYFLLRKPAREFFTTRLAEVRATLQQAAKEKEGATAKMAELDARLSRLDTELADIKSQAHREAAAERERLQAEAQRDAEKIRVTSKREIESAKQIAMSELREFAATKAVDLAEQMIRRELKPEDDARLVQRMGEEMSKAS